MNWFTAVAVVVGVLIVGYAIRDLVRPGHGGVRHNRLREKYQGEDFYRGGAPFHGDDGFGGGGSL